MKKRSWHWKLCFCKEASVDMNKNCSQKREHRSWIYEPRWNPFDFDENVPWSWADLSMGHNFINVCSRFCEQFPKYLQRKCPTLNHPNEHLFWGVSLRWKMLTMRADPSTSLPTEKPTLLRQQVLIMGCLWTSKILQMVLNPRGEGEMH